MVARTAKRGIAGADDENRLTYGHGLLGVKQTQIYGTSLIVLGPWAYQFAACSERLGWL
jgi:hypothetical protein